MFPSIYKASVNPITVNPSYAITQFYSDLVHPNVIRYYGATFEKSWSGLIWIMVMELCQGSLKNLYIGTQTSLCHPKQTCALWNGV